MHDRRQYNRGRFHQFLLGKLATSELGSRPALAKNHDAITNRDEFRKLARRYDDRETLGAEFIDQPIDFRLRADVDSSSRIVKQQQFRSRPKRPSNDALLLIAATQAGNRRLTSSGLHS